MKVSRRTDWTADGRAVFWTPGFDCSIVCEHEKKGDHGQHGDELLLAVRRGDIAFSLEIGTFVRDGIVTYRKKDGRITTGQGLYVHVPWPIDEDQVRSHLGGADCKIIDRPCFSTLISLLRSDYVWTAESEKAIRDALLTDKVEHAVLALGTGVWETLSKEAEMRETWANEQRATLRCLCPTCGGAGLVARSNGDPS